MARVTISPSHSSSVGTRTDCSRWQEAASPNAPTCIGTQRVGTSDSRLDTKATSWSIDTWIMRCHDWDMAYERWLMIDDPLVSVLVLCWWQLCVLSNHDSFVLFVSHNPPPSVTRNVSPVPEIFSLLTASDFWSRCRLCKSIYLSVKNGIESVFG